MRGRIKVPVAELEFDVGGNTLWVHSPAGATVLRLKLEGGKFLVDDKCVNSVAHVDVISQEGDVTVCVPGRRKRA